MTSYLVTGATGLLGRRVLARLLERADTAQVSVLVRRDELPALAAVTDRLDAGERVVTVLGEPTPESLAIADPAGPIDHLLHLGTLDDPTAAPELLTAVNVESTAALAAFAAERGATLHLLSSSAVAGTGSAPFTEDDFDAGQEFPTPNHRSFFDAELAVRQTPGLAWRIYRPSSIVGDSVTGEMDRVSGPYHFFGLLGALGRLPAQLPLPWPGLGEVNMVPVDYVADALVALHDQPQTDGQVFHLGDPLRRTHSEMVNALAPAIGGPRTFEALPEQLVRPALAVAGAGPLRPGRNLLVEQLGVPPVLLDVLTETSAFSSERTAEQLAALGVASPEPAEYGPRLWEFWEAELDPARHRQDDPRGPLVGKHILITGGSSGIGRAAARMAVARGAHVFLVARDADKLAETAAELSAETPKPGLPLGTVSFYPVDVTDEDAVQTMVKSVIAEHEYIDILVNNAGRSIRRATVNALDRSHDYHRTMAVNYFGAVYLTLAVLPHMIERQNGHIVNVSSITAQTREPRFGAYAASNAALEAFADVTGSETLSDHVTFTNVRLPLTRTRMIAPTRAYDSAHGIWGVDKAASRILRAMITRPKRVNSLLGDLVQFGHRAAPRLTNRLLHQEFLVFGEPSASGRRPDSA